MKKYLKNYIIVLLIVIESVFLFLAVKSFYNNDKIILSNETIIDSNKFAMFIETDNGYEEYNNTTFPSNYIINLDNSNCIDEDGNFLEDVISIVNDNIQVKTTTTSFCYLYFDVS